MGLGKDTLPLEMRVSGERWMDVMEDGGDVGCVLGLTRRLGECVVVILGLGGNIGR